MAPQAFPPKNLAKISQIDKFTPSFIYNEEIFLDALVPNSFLSQSYEMIASAFFKLVYDYKLSPNDLEQFTCLEAVCILHCVSKYASRNIF